MKLQDFFESDASDEAQKRGLTHVGFGNWADSAGQTVAYTDEDGNLRDVNDNDADDFAQMAHGDQQYGQHPYKYHLDKVVDNARRFNGTKTQILCARLHDVIEDTAITKEQLASRFGNHVAHVVDLVSNQSKEHPDWKQTTLERIRTEPDAVFVKLCDRIANVAEGGKIGKYRKEYPLFRGILYREGEYEDMWRVLDDLHGTT